MASWRQSLRSFPIPYLGRYPMERRRRQRQRKRAPCRIPLLECRAHELNPRERSELLAASNDVEAMRALIDADSLAFISIDGLYRAMGAPGRDPVAPAYCDACFSGEYPIRLTAQDDGSTGRPLSLLAKIA